MSTPEQNLIHAFWKCLRDDIAGRGCTSDDLSPEQRRLEYKDRVIIERENLQNSGLDFLKTNDFDFWAGLSHLNPAKLRGRFYAIRDN